MTFRLLPMGLKLNPASVEQSGADAFLTVAYGFLPQLTSTSRLGFDVGLRARRWQLKPGAVPNTSHAGLLVAARYETPKWNALFETALMAIGVGSTSLGNQRDSSTLRIRGTYNFDEGFLDVLSARFTTWLEFFHTHRSFFGGTIVPGENSLFIDEAALSLGFGITL